MKREEEREVNLDWVNLKCQWDRHPSGGVRRQRAECTEKWLRGLADLQASALVFLAGCGANELFFDYRLTRTKGQPRLPRYARPSRAAWPTGLNGTHGTIS